MVAADGPRLSVRSAGRGPCGKTPALVRRERSADRLGFRTLVDGFESMMSRSRILAFVISSRQMMYRLGRVSGLSQKQAIMALAASLDTLGDRDSPSAAKSSSTKPISRRYIRTGSSVHSDGSARVSALTSRFCGSATGRYLLHPACRRRPQSSLRPLPARRR